MAEMINHLRAISAWIRGRGKWEAKDFVQKERDVSELDNDPFFQLAKYADWREVVMGDRNAWKKLSFYLKMKNQAIPCSSEDPLPEQK